MCCVRRASHTSPTPHGGKYCPQREGAQKMPCGFLSLYRRVARHESGTAKRKAGAGRVAPPPSALAISSRLSRGGALVSSCPFTTERLATPWASPQGQDRRTTAASCTPPCRRRQVHHHLSLLTDHTPMSSYWSRHHAPGHKSPGPRIKALVPHFLVGLGTMSQAKQQP